MIAISVGLKEWRSIGNFGYSVDIYAKGTHRILVDRDSKEVMCRYVVEGCSGDGVRRTKIDEGNSKIE